MVHFNYLVLQLYIPYFAILELLPPLHPPLRVQEGPPHLDTAHPSPRYRIKGTVPTEVSAASKAIGTQRRAVGEGKQPDWTLVLQAVLCESTTVLQIMEGWTHHLSRFRSRSQTTCIHGACCCSLRPAAAAAHYDTFCQG